MASLDSHVATRADEVVEIFQRCGALLDGDHFVYVSGDHGAGWVAKDLLYPDPTQPRRLGRLLADAVRERGIEVDYVCGPATGGLVTAQWVASALGCRSIFSEHDAATGPTGPFVLQRGFGEMVKGRRVLAVDDIVNTGHSIVQTLAALRAAEADVVGATAWVTRGNVTGADIGVEPWFPLAQVDIPSWPAHGCQLCTRGFPINTRFAHGKEFVARHGQPNV